MVISGVNTVTYNGDGVTTAWPFTFPVTDDSEIRVQLNNTDGTAVIVEKDYYVDLVNSTVYYPGYAPGAEPPEEDQPPKVQEGQTITVYREIPMTQEADLGEKWPFEVIEKGLDKLTMIAQQIDSGTKRTIDNALASMEMLADVVVDSGELQHITEQLNEIDSKVEEAEDFADAAADSESNALSYKNAAAGSATDAAASEANAQTILNAILNSYGYPFTAATAADMTDTTKIYVYVGSEAGYTVGDWYYYNGSVWVSGGNFTSLVSVDPTLTISGAAADSKVVGDTFAYEEKNIVNIVGDSFGLTNKETVALPTFTNDHYWSVETSTAVDTPYNGSYGNYAPIEVSACERYYIHIYQGTSTKQRPVVIVDENYAILQKVPATLGSNGYYDYDFVTPQNAKYMLLTTYETQHTNTTVKKEVSVDIGTQLKNIFGGKYVVNASNSALTLPTFTDDHYWSVEADVVADTSFVGKYGNYAPIEVSAGEWYSVYIYQGTSDKQRPIVIVDENYKKLQIIPQTFGTIGYYTYDFVVPQNAKYMLLTTYDNSKHTLTKINKKILPAIGDNNTGDVNNAFRDKVVAIIGDSISTNGDYSSTQFLGNVPEIVIEEDDVGVSLSAYATYYDIDTTVGGHTITADDVGTEITFTPVAGDVGKVVGKPLNYNPYSRKTWWEVAMEELNFIPIPVCWSGSSITSHEGNENIRKTSYAWHDAQIRKCGVRTPGTMTRVAPDYIIIYRGANDFSHTPYTRLTNGFFDDANWDYPTTDYHDGVYGFKEGLCLTIKKLRAAYPNAQIVLCTLNVLKRVNYSHFPTNNGYNTLPQYNDAIREVADYMGCHVIEFDKDGITFENCYSGGYITDSSVTPTHPNDKGHKVMGNRAIKDLLQINSMS